MPQGINRALNNKSFDDRYGFASEKPCIFLSHRSLDKDFVEKIGLYIRKAGIDIYLDKYDNRLQNADAIHDDKLITKCIQNGIKESTHVMCALSENTINSWWVPYEIGYGDDANKKIFSLKLKDISDNQIPSYLKINTCLYGIQQLNSYLKQVANNNNIEIKTIEKFANKQYEISSNENILQETSYVHPLSDYLDL